MVKIGIIQMGSVPEKGTNIQKALDYSEKAVSDGAEIIVFNELFSTQYFPTEEDVSNFDLAEHIKGPTIEKFQSFSKKNKVIVIPTIFEEDTIARGIYYDTAVFINKFGEIGGIYRKIHLPQLNGYYEKFYFHPGSGYPVFDFGDYKLGSVICYDRHFPEGPRILSLKGADIVVIPTTTNFYPETWELEIKAHAAFNTNFVVGVNRTPETYKGKNIKYFGKSLIAGPSGETIYQMSGKEGVAVIDININDIRNRRRKAPFIADRKIIAYKEIVERDVGDIDLIPMKSEEKR